LKKSTLDLFEAWKSIRLALLNQLSELKSNQVKQQLQTPLELSGTLYGVIQGWVSYKALRKVKEQQKLLLGRDSSLFCTGIFSRVYGLPYLHVLDALQDKALLLTHFHSQWHLRQNGTPQLLLEPRQQIEPIIARCYDPPSTGI